MREERRRASRVKRRATVTFEANEKVYRGIATEFSQYGFYLESRNIFSRQTSMVIRLLLSKGNEVTVRGKVVQFRPGNRMGGIGVQSQGMGIVLDSFSPGYRNFLLEIGGGKRAV